MRASRRAAIPLLALTGMAWVAPTAYADSINLLRQGAPRLSPSILVNSSTIGTTSDENAEAIDRECVAIDDDVRSSWSRFGRVEFRFGRFAWEWDPQAATGIVYVICVERSGHGMPGGGGGGGGGMSMGGAMMMAAAGSWANRSSAGPMAAGPGVIASIDDAGLSVSGSDPTSNIAWSADRQPERHGPSIDHTLATWSDIEPLLTMPVGPQSALTESVLGAGLPAAFDSPVSPLAPIDAAPVPEPATLLLFGTGLAAAWRARKKTGK